MLALSLLALLSFTFCVSVYIVPYLSGQSFEGAFDAFTYAENMTEDSVRARELQPFLNLYPDWPGVSLFFYALLLHAFLLVPALNSVRHSLGSRGFVIILTAISVPESAVFLGSVSKEGLGIVAVVAALAGQTLAVRGFFVRGTIMCTYSIFIAELSRPFYGLPFGVALLISFAPALSYTLRRVAFAALVTTLLIGVWAILHGPFAAEFTIKYQAAKQFLDWFEQEMSSDSSVKSAVRQFFALAFSSDQPSLILLLLICLAAIGKALVYAFAIPLISPAGFTNMPAQVWALTWQAAASMSSIAMIFGFMALRQRSLDVESRCRLWFGLTLLIVISISTAIFHVRYRAPAMIVLLATAWLITSNQRHWLVWMTLPTVLASFIGILSTT